MRAKQPSLEQRQIEMRARKLHYTALPNRKRRHITWREMPEAQYHQTLFMLRGRKKVRGN